MRRVGIAAGILALVVLSGCGGDSDSAKPSESPSATAATPSPAPEIADTYVPADGDPKTHILHVTIRDVGGVETYEATAKGCVPLNPPHTTQLVVSGPTSKFDYTPLKEAYIPATAEPVNGACEAKLTIKVRYAPRYSLGIALEGQGIATGDEPPPAWITTRGSSQEVTVVSQVVTTLR
ncbi:hypothetical protein J2X11_000650 [Aeromicrobium panaciterrae]|uniref:Lipoprotein n=1 Tax=Aeromicrobium panaciterrae TaxID=363861 RepID=A0ABU1UKW6_9ACTN|nr:hypothetical protein [Aeromicrobium panaciterrae]MDR7085811.1 hypothetical protein [Aeromicrobium panaciterrae]